MRVELSVEFNFNDEIFSETYIEFALEKVKTRSRIDSLLGIYE